MGVHPIFTHIHVLHDTPNASNSIESSFASCTAPTVGTLSRDHASEGRWFHVNGILLGEVDTWENHLKKMHQAMLDYWGLDTAPDEL